MSEICIYDYIGGDGVTAAFVVAELKKANGQPVTVRINSGGGDVTEGVAIFNALRRYSGGVTVVIDFAASIASYIALAGQHVTMAENGYLMIHEPSCRVNGGAEEMRQTANLIDRMRDTLSAAYVLKSGRSADEISVAMKNETWFTAGEALAFGLIDEITEPLAMAAKFDLSKFKNAPRVDTLAASMATTIKAEDAPETETPETDAPAETSTEHTDPVALDPCPFCGSEDLDDGGEQIKCNNCSAMGPVAGSGMDQRGAWNKRGSDTADDPAPDDAPLDDPAPVARSKKLDEVKAAFTAEHEKAKRLHAGFKQAAAAARKAQANLTTIAASNAEAIRDKVEAETKLAKVTADFEAHKRDEPRRLNALATTLVAAQGKVPPVKTEAAAKAAADKPKPSASNLTGLARATAAHTAARTK